MAEKKERTAKELADASTDELIDDSKGVYRRLFGYIKQYRGRLAWGVFFGVLAGLMDGLLILVLKNLFTIVLPGTEGEETPTEIAIFENIPIAALQEITLKRPDISVMPEWVFVALACLCVPMLMLVRGVFTFIHQYCFIWLNNRLLYRLRDESFTGIMRQSLSFFNTVKQGELVQTVANQTRTTADAGLNMVSALIKHPVSIISIFTILLWENWLYTLGAMIVFPLCIAPVAMIARKVRKSGGREEQEAEGLMVTLYESFAGVRLVKAHAREEYQRARFNEGSSKIIKFIMRWKKAMEISSPLVEIVASFGIVVGMIYAWFTKIDSATFTALNLGLISIYPHAKALSRLHVQLQKCLVAARKVFGYIDAVPDVRDKPDAKVLRDCQGTIQFDNVVFAYEKGKNALDGVNLNFEAGKKYALVGQSGSGKSTVLSLAMRFYDPDTGCIRVDDDDIRDLTQESLRDQIGLVSQDTFLFHDTIRANLRYGMLEATDEQIEEAAKLAHAHEFIIEQINGYDTILGDKGCTLSGGQQQRLSIARAILRDAPILFLDEAMSALDSESEKIIHEAIQELSKGKTVVAIAHRLSTILDSDEIIVMREGKVLDSAPHNILLERCEEYQRLYQIQFREEE